MKRNQKILVTAVLGAVSALALNTATAAITPVSIKDSPHNLGSGNVQGGAAGKTPSGAAVANHSANTAEVCVFCHTPHGGDSGAAVPIWNRRLGIGGVGATAVGALGYGRYSALGTTTFDSAEAPIGSVSIACLSCHDGSQAMDNVINMPGSGGYNPAGAPIGGFTGGDQAGGKLLPGVVQNLGTDLSNDHPVSMQYGGGGITITTPTVAKTADVDFRMPSVMNAPPGSTLGKLWYIETGSTDSLNGVARDRQDVLLYTRTDVIGGGGIGQPTVECGSCHDPHNVRNQTFLRVSNAGKTSIANNSDSIYPNANGGPSALCLTCHTK